MLHHSAQALLFEQGWCSLLAVDTIIKCCYFPRPTQFFARRGFSMYEVSIETHFSAAHRLRHYRGLCENLHGHNWKVEVTVCAEVLDEAGMVIDFSILKQKTNSIIDQLDHQYLNELPPFADINPSSENLAAYIYDHLSKALKEHPVTLARVCVWESDKAKASYTPYKVYHAVT